VKQGLTVEQAKKEIMRVMQPLGTEMIYLQNAVGRILSHDIRAPFDLPQFSNSAMDGYAVQARDLRNGSGTGPVELSLIETIAAGHSPRRSIKRGQASAVMTGGKIPKGADSVVIVEKTEKRGRKVRILAEPQNGTNIRKKGEIVRREDVLIKKGTKISTVGVGILATFNIAKIKVTRKPRIAIFSTGDELVPLGRKLRDGQIVDSNRHALIAELDSHGYSITDLGVIRDRENSTLHALKKAAQVADAIITIGGVSMGEFDYVRKGIVKLGRIIFWKVKMKPGGPQAFGMIRGKPIFGLPGNPVSSLLVFRLFVSPALQKMAAEKPSKQTSTRTILLAPLKSKKDKTQFIPVKLTKNGLKKAARPIHSAGSHDLTGWINADGIALVPAGKKGMDKGSLIKTLEW